MVGPQEQVRAEGPWALVLEDGTEAEGVDRLPEDLPLGYHDLHRPDRPAVRLIVAPPACHLPEGMRTWGWAAQLPSVRSARSWGIGDLGDVAELGRWAAGRGAGVLMLSPLHAPVPVPPIQPSPYFASSRCFRNPLYLRVEDVAGAGRCHDLTEAARAGQALNDSPLVDRDAVWKLKAAVLEPTWRASPAARGADPGFEAYRRRHGQALEAFATFCALSEVRGADWRDWPEGLRRPDSAAVADFAAANADRVGYHAWLQWLIEEQLARAGDRIGLVQDLAIGVDPAGADAWMWRDLMATGVRVGAPPDDFNAAGQDWGLPPFDPWKLRQAGFDPLARTLRAVLAHSAGVRIDHIAGLFRLFWIPPGASAGEGAYVRYPWSELLSVLALESVRAGAWVVGEDLGTVEDRVREEMERRRLLSTRLLWFEPGPPAGYPSRTMAAVTTHDLPTVAGLWSGGDAAELARLGLPAADGFAPVRRRLADWTGLPDDAPVEEAVRAAYRLLAQAPSAVALATLEDAAAMPERPNLPGTVDDRPNWSLALPRPLEELVSSPLADDLGRSLASGRSSGPSGG
ncbi:MAG TPA: 4-alpha-glucanotransferase [Acidimicrobiales bacterium]|nr:4-alpha-glucanotransferase [Acidimicrobiales bacterium]